MTQTEQMSEKAPSTRMRLVRDVAVLQIKLLVDGLRDALLIPVSILAAMVGLFRGGENADLEFQRVLKLARRSERWINAFGHDTNLDRPHQSSTLDHLLDRVESVVMEQYRKGRSTEEARAAINAAMKEVAGETSRQGPEEESSV